MLQACDAMETRHRGLGGWKPGGRGWGGTRASEAGSQLEGDGREPGVPAEPSWMRKETKGEIQSNCVFLNFRITPCFGKC